MRAQSGQCYRSVEPWPVGPLLSTLSTPAQVTHRHPCLCAMREPAPSQSMTPKKSIPFMPNLEVLRLDKGDKKGRCGGYRCDLQGILVPRREGGSSLLLHSFPSFLPDHFYKISLLNHYNAKFCVKEKRCPKPCKTQNNICSDF